MVNKLDDRQLKEKNKEKTKKSNERQIALDYLVGFINERASDLKGNVFLSLYSTAEIFSRFVEIETSKRKLNPTLFTILHTLILRGGSMAPSEISPLVFRSKHAITRAVDTLENSGLVKRQLSKEDRRVRQVIITQKGLDFIKANTEETRKLDNLAMSCLSANQAEQLKSILTVLRKHLQTLMKESKE
jgi:DNA-binding MarR family transcriptional regulator